MPDQHIVLGPYTAAKQVELRATGAPPALPPDFWHVRTDIGGYGGKAPPGVEPQVRAFEALEAAQAAVEWRLRHIGALPEGYSLREVKLAPGDGGHAFMFYKGPGAEIMLVQTPVGPQPRQASEGSVGITTRSVVVSSNGSVEQTDLDGHPAAWIDGHSLAWEADGVAYHLGGLGLALEQAMALARSLQ